MKEDAFTKLWQLIMRIALGMAILLFMTEIVSFQKSGSNPFPTTAALAFVGFLLTFFRFWFGQWRHLEFCWEKSGSYTWEGIATTRNALLLVQGIIFCYMAACILSLNHFLIAFIILLSINIIWLVTGLIHLLSLYQGVTYVNLRSHIHPLCCWTINNTIAVVLILSIIAQKSDLYLALGIAILLLNSYFDFMLTQDYYKKRIEFH